MFPSKYNSRLGGLKFNRDILIFERKFNQQALGNKMTAIVASIVAKIL